MAGPLLSDRWPDGDAVRVQIFRALVEVLRTDPVLAALEVTWRTWTGDPRDADPPARGELPWVRLTPVRSGQKLGSEDSWDVEMRVKVEFAVEGTCWDDLANLSAYFAQALRYNRTTGAGLTVLKTLRDSGATVYDFEQSGLSAVHTEAPATGPGEPAPPAAVDLTAEAQIVIQFLEPALD